MKKHILLALAVLGFLSASAQTQILMPMPAQNSTFTGSVRGYWFTSPSCITITGVQVPTTASTGPQSIAIVRLNAPPPLFSATTNSFTVLYLTQSNPASGIIPVNIQVEQGDIIGVLGQRATVGSYATGPATTTIDGNTVTLARLGMQFPLTTTAPQQLWTENGGSISRVELFYDTLISNTVSATQQSFDTYSFASTADTSFTIAWNFGDNTPVQVADTPTHQYLSSGTFNVCCYITNSCGIDTICTTVSICGATTAAYTSSASGATVSFTDQSLSSPTSWSWNFGDNSPLNTSQNPTHTYTASGLYTVSLIVSNSCSSDTFSNTISVCIPTVASFTSVANLGAVQFTDASVSEVTNWAWDFGDVSAINSTQNPQHTYTASGTYTVCLIASSQCSSDTFCSAVTVCLPVSVSYASTVNGGTASFTETSANATTWVYDYGDGSPLDTVQNGQHTYTTNGTYTACVIASSLCSADTFCNTVTICLPISVSYTSTVNGGTASFTETSANATTWVYDYGDGSPLDTVQNGQHTYAVNGSYVVCITASSSCSTSTWCDTISICNPAVANFSWVEGSASFLFSDSSQHATSWSWDFGDGSPVDTNQNTTHLYQQNGIYTVCLIVTNECSSDTFCTTITNCMFPVNSAFTSTGTGFNYNFTNGSSNAVSYFWDFDDNGATSTQAAPSHTFSFSGQHIICLTSYGFCGDSITVCDTVLVQIVGVHENNFGTATVSVFPNPMSDAAMLLVQSAEFGGVFTLELMDVSGKVVRTENGMFNEAHTIARGELAAGMYAYRILQNETVIGNGKLIIQ